MRLKRWIEIAMMLGSMPLVVMLHGCHDESWKFRECVCLAQPEPQECPALPNAEPSACYWTDSFGFILPPPHLLGDSGAQPDQDSENLQQHTNSTSPIEPPDAPKPRKPHKAANTADNRIVAVNTGNCIDINTADERQLTTLPGVGKGRAQAIIESRTRKPFKRKKDITRIKGIGAQSYRKMADSICEIVAAK